MRAGSPGRGGVGEGRYPTDPVSIFSLRCDWERGWSWEVFGVNFGGFEGVLISDVRGKAHFSPAPACEWETSHTTNTPPPIPLPSPLSDLGSHHGRNP